MLFKSGSAVLLALTCVSAEAAPITIDPFNSTQIAVIASSASPSNPTNVISSTANNAPLSLGGQREFIARRSNGNGKVELDINDTAESALSFTSTGNAIGRGLVIWDGPDTTTGPFDPRSSTDSIVRGEPNAFGLTGSGTTGGVDLTDGGTNNAIVFHAYADNQGLPVIFHFYRSAGVFATATLHIPGNTSGFQMNAYSIFFGNFVTNGATANEIFKDVKAITMQVDGRNGSDAQFDLLGSANVPEPSTMSLSLVAGLLGFLGIRRRR